MSADRTAADQTAVPPEQPAAAAEKTPVPTLTYTGPSMTEAVGILGEKKQTYRGMGGPEKIARQHSLGKMTVRERIDVLFDEDSFTEFGMLGHHQSQSPQMQGK